MLKRRVVSALLAVCLGAALAGGSLFPSELNKTGSAVQEEDPWFEEYQEWYFEVLNAGDDILDAADGSGVRIAVLDTGIYPEHEDFADADIEKGYNYLDDNTDTTDTNGHGTLISGIICAGSENGIGIRGLADGVTIIPLKCFDGETTKISCVAEAIYDAADVYDCDIILMSWATDTDSETLHDAVSYAAAAGVFLVAPSGNAGGEEDLYPAAYDEVISAAALNIWNERASFSQANDGVTLCVPAVSIYGPGISSEDEYVSESGTSYGSAIAAAAAALALSLDEDLTQDEFIQLISDTSEDLGEEGYDPEYGYGLLNMEALLSVYLD